MHARHTSHQTIQTIACQQVLQENATVFSIQWTDIPASVAMHLTARKLFIRYLRALRRQTCNLVLPRLSREGVVFSLAGYLPLLEFQTCGEPSCKDRYFLRIVGGLLLQPGECKNGQLQFAVTHNHDGTTRLTLQLLDYCPLLLGSNRPSWLRRLLYRFTQAAIHQLVTVRFLTGLYRELTGSRACVQLVKVRVREGHPT